MADIERPDDLDPCPMWAADWLDATNDQGVSMFTARLAALIEESNQTLYVDLLADELSYTAEGPDDHGVYAVTLTRKDTGAEAACLEVHWRALHEVD